MFWRRILGRTRVKRFICKSFLRSQDGFENLESCDDQTARQKLFGSHFFKMRLLDKVPDFHDIASGATLVDVVEQFTLQGREA